MCFKNRRIAIGLFIYIVLKFLFIKGDVIDNSSSSSNSESDKCINQTVHRIVVEFTSNVVQNEYIVVFDGYFRKKSRENYIRAALGDSQVSAVNQANWTRDKDQNPSKEDTPRTLRVFKKPPSKSGMDPSRNVPKFLVEKP
jgi:hypothetical protein